jgi:hypothetical protein
MGVFDQGGGGGRAPDFPPVDVYALDMPYDVTGDPSVDKMQQIDEMLRLLFQAAQKNKDRIGALNTGANGVLVSDTTLTVLQCQTLNTVPVLLIPPPTTAGQIIVPINWSVTKVTTAVGVSISINLEYADATWSGFVLMAPMTVDTNNIRKAQFVGFPSVGLTNINVTTRTALNKGIWVRGSANQAGSTTMRIRVVYYVMASL